MGFGLRKIAFVLSIHNAWFSQSFTINCPKWVAWHNIEDGTLRGFGEDVTGVTQEASVLFFARLVHILSLVVLGLSVRYETWPPVGWHRPFVMCWSKYRLGLHQSQWIDHWKFSPFFRGHWQSSCTAVTAGICLLLRLCKETVKESTSLQTGRYFRHNGCMSS